MSSRCSHGIECEVIYQVVPIDGEDFFSRVEYWHNEDEKCGDRR